MVVKKYSNRRMYDTVRSKYVRLEELAQRIRAGEDIRVVDADSGEDLTHSVLVQLVVESRGAAHLLPEALLTRLMRLDDTALAEFFGQWMGWALEAYLSARQRAQALPPPVAPYAAAAVDAAQAFARQWGQPPPGWGQPAGGAPAPWPPQQSGPWPPQAAAPSPAEPPPGAPDPGEWPEEEGEVESGVRTKGGGDPASRSEVAALRRELEEIKGLLRGGSDREVG